MFNCFTPLLSYNVNVNSIVANYFMHSLPVFNFPGNSSGFTGKMNTSAYCNYEQIHFSGWDKNIYTNLYGSYCYNNYSDNYGTYLGSFKYNYYPAYGNFINFMGSSSATPTSSTEVSNNKTTAVNTPTSSNKLTEVSQKSEIVNNKVTKTVGKKETPKMSLGEEFLKTAEKYRNVNEEDGSQIKFCVNEGCFPGNYGEWCTDFVSYVVKESYRNQNRPIPQRFGTHDVEELKLWAQSHNSDAKFLRTSNIAKKGEFIKQNIKPGDIFILNENGASHTGFVSRVNDDGSFITIEGNRDDMVKSYTYSPDFDQLSGFIRLT